MSTVRNNLTLSNPRRLRTWLAFWLQDRRRQRAHAAPAGPPAPVIVGGWYAWDDTTPGWADNYVTISFNSGSFSGGVFEIWERDVGHPLSQIDTIDAEALVDYRHAQVTQTGGTFYYKVRWRNGPDVGPFSNEFAVVVDPA